MQEQIATQGMLLRQEFDQLMPEKFPLKRLNTEHCWETKGCIVAREIITSIHNEQLANYQFISKNN